jgi:F0F1-type ATP synthase membrane subunit c/vacuolar-type H+-ATPase subunit K
VAAGLDEHGDGLVGGRALSACMQGEILDYLVEGAARRPTGAPA